MNAFSNFRILFIGLLLPFTITKTNAQQWIDKKYVYDSLYNVTYGTAVSFSGGLDTLKMDIFSPRCLGNQNQVQKPLLLVFYGGAFIAGNKGDATIQAYCKAFARRGYVTAAINYRLGVISDEIAWNCNYPNYKCIFATDSSEWIRAGYRAMQDGKGALRYLVNRHQQFQIDTNNIFVMGESAGAFTALNVAFMDTLVEKPISAGVLSDAPTPNTNAAQCLYNIGKTFQNTIPRPDLGSIDGNIEPTTIRYTIKGVGNLFGGVLLDIFKNTPKSKQKAAVYNFHQPCDLIVPIKSDRMLWGLSWCFTNGYQCYGVKNTPMVHGSKSIADWNTNYNYGINMKNEFGTINFPYSFLIGERSCSDQVNTSCHSYDNQQLRELNMATFFAGLITTSPCSSTTDFQEVEFTEGQLKIYPNPFSEYITIENLSDETTRYELTNVFGQCLHSGILHSNRNRIDLKNISQTTIYFLTVFRQNSSKTYKLQKL